MAAPACSEKPLVNMHGSSGGCSDEFLLWVRHRLGPCGDCTVSDCTATQCLTVVPLCHNRPGDNLSADEPIRIRYSKASKKVTFTLGDFIYSQTGLPDDVDFAIAVGLIEPPMKAEV